MKMDEAKSDSRECCQDHMVLRAVGFHHHTVETLGIRTLDQPSVQQEAEHTGRLLTNDTRGDKVS